MRSAMLTRLTFAVLAAVALAACSTPPVKTEPPPPAPVAPPPPPPPPPPPQPVPPPPPPPAPTPAPVVEQKPTLPDYLNPDSEIRRQHLVLFGFDQSSIDVKFNGLLDLQAGYLSKHPEVQITVEGHTDERGSREYNLALGERRAKAVVQALTTRGVNPGQLSDHSWGKEKPVAEGHDEAAWAQNRRADLVYPTK